MLSKLKLAQMHWCNDPFSVFAVELLYMLHLKIAFKKKRNILFFMFLHSRNQRLKQDGPNFPKNGAATS